jgi:hypothetical protein
MKYFIGLVIACSSFTTAYANNSGELVSGMVTYYSGGSFAVYARQAEFSITQEAVKKCANGVKRVFDISLQLEADFAQADKGKSEKELEASSYPQAVYTAKVECN